MYKKLICAVAVIAAVSLVGRVALAQDISSLQAKIQALLSEIAQLKLQLSQTQSNSATAQWCHTFNTNLGSGISGSEVSALQQALSKEGFDVQTDVDTRTYGDFTASAVSGFQEKYVSDILSPSGLKYPTGYVGKSTRAKLNSLYGCGSITPPIVIPPIIYPTSTYPWRTQIQVTSPKAGDSWQLGETHTISWAELSPTPECSNGGPCYTPQSSGTSTYSNSSPYSQVQIYLVPQIIPQTECKTGTSGTVCPMIETLIPSYYIITKSAPDTGSYSWTIPSSLVQIYTGQVTIKIQSILGTGTSGAFYLGKGTTPGQSPVISGVSGPTALKVGQQGTWTVNASDPQNGVLTYSVLWGDEIPIGTTNGMPGALIYPQPKTQQSATFTHVYNSAGTYQPKFTVTNSAGLSAQTSLSVVVSAADTTGAETNMDMANTLESAKILLQEILLKIQ